MDDDETKARIDRRQFLKAASLAGGGVLLAACAPAAVSPAGTPARIATPTPARLSFAAKGASPAFGMAQTAAIHIGEVKGFFKEEGIETTWTEFAGGADQVRAVVTGGFNYGIVSMPGPVPSFVKGEPVKAICSGYWGPMIGWLVPKDSPLKSVQDLKGKQLSYSRPASWSHFVALLVARELGLKPDQDIKLLSTGGIPDSWAAAKGGIVDATWSSPPLMQKMVLDGEARVLFWAHEILKDALELCIVTTKSFADERPDVIRAFVRGYQRSIDWVRDPKNQEEAAKAWKQHLDSVGIKHDLPVLAQTIKDIPSEHLTLKFNKKAFDILESLMLEFKLIDGKVDWNGFADQQFLPPDQRITL